MVTFHKSFIHNMRQFKAGGTCTLYYLSNETCTCHGTCDCEALDLNKYQSNVSHIYSLSRNLTYLPQFLVGNQQWFAYNDRKFNINNTVVFNRCTSYVTRLRMRKYGREAVILIIQTNKTVF